MTAIANAESDFARWCAERETQLRDPEGWLTLVDLVWLTPGTLTIGSAADCGLHLPAGAPRLGQLEVSDHQILWRPEQGPALCLQSDAQGPPTLIRLGRYSFHVIEREGSPALRVKDRNAPALATFAGIRRFPYDPAWRIEARWEEGQAAFDYQGSRYILRPLNAAADPLQFVFGDRSNGTDTYGGGRFLFVAATDDRLVLDFNRAINPPCVFTPYATCPLPAPGNRLPFAIAAGEKI